MKHEGLRSRVGEAIKYKFSILESDLESLAKLHPRLHEVPAVLTVGFVEEDEGVFVGGKYDLFHGGGNNIQHRLA